MARDWQWEGRGQGRAGEVEQRPFMRLFLAAWWNAQAKQNGILQSGLDMGRGGWDECLSSHCRLCVEAWHPCILEGWEEGWGRFRSVAVCEGH